MPQRAEYIMYTSTLMVRVEQVFFWQIVTPFIKKLPENLYSLDEADRSRNERRVGFFVLMFYQGIITVLRMQEYSNRRNVESYQKLKRK